MASERPTVVITTHDAGVTARAIHTDAIPISDLPAEPFPLGSRGLHAFATVRDPLDCEAALVALARGVDLVLTLDIGGAQGAAFVDDLARVSNVSARDSDSRAGLSADQVALLDGLASGRTLTDVARSLGMSRRTATRRVSEARAILGVTTTIEALRLFEPRRPSP
jgi:hypothetical protein